jgi:hypothetical protein
MTFQNISTYNNIINKKYESCGCIINSDLDILENIIQDYHIQLCKHHYTKQDYNQKINKSNYYFNKQIQKYIYKNNNNKVLKKNKSYDNIQSIVFNNFKSNQVSHNLVNFGKYANKTYEYVYYSDKLYCYNLAFWNNKKYNNNNIQRFINYIKNQLLIESN